MGSGADSPCQGEMAQRARGGRVGDYEHEVLIEAVPGGVLPNPSLLPAKPSEAGSPGRGGARERTQFSPPGGNGVEWTLRRRAAVGKVTRRPQAAESPPRQIKSLYHRPLIRHGFAVPPSPKGEGLKRWAAKFSCEKSNQERDDPNGTVLPARD